MTQYTKRARKEWSAEDVTTLSELYDTKTAAAISAILGRNRSCVYAKAHSLGLKKSSGGLGRSQRAIDPDSRSKAGRFQPRHGRSTGKKDPTYRTWISMNQRCKYSKHKSYRVYGQIAICDRWSVFENFLADMGERPPGGYTLDRIDNTKGYEPSNCRWATHKQQARNRANNRVIEFNGKAQTVAEWSDETGIPQDTLTKRIDDGRWPIQRALTDPVATRWRKVGL